MPGRRVLHSTHKPKKAHPTRHPVLHSRHPGEIEDTAGDVSGRISVKGPRYRRDAAGNVTTTTHQRHTATTKQAHQRKTKSERTRKNEREYNLISPGEPTGGPMQGYIDMLKAQHRYSRKTTSIPKGYIKVEGAHGWELEKKTASAGKTHQKTKTDTPRHTKRGVHSTHHASSTGAGADSRNATPAPPGPIEPVPARLVDRAGHVHPHSAKAPPVTPASSRSVKTSAGAGARHHS